MKIFLFTHTDKVDETLLKTNIEFIDLNLSTLSEKYFESRGYELINLPQDEEETVCFISPSVFLKSKLTSKTLCNDPIQKKNEIKCIVKPNYISLYWSQFYHGKTFIILWNYFLEKKNLLQYAGQDFTNCNCNMFYIKCKQAKQFKNFICEGIKIIESFTGYYKELLNSDSGYQGNLNSAQLLKKFGFPYYPYHPFICERFIGLFAHIHKINLT